MVVQKQSIVARVVIVVLCQPTHLVGKLRCALHELFYHRIGYIAYYLVADKDSKIVASLRVWWHDLPCHELICWSWLGEVLWLCGRRDTDESDAKETKKRTNLTWGQSTWLSNRLTRPVGVVLVRDERWHDDTMTTTEKHQQTPTVLH